MFISRILVPTDFSADASAALDYAQELGRPFGASVCLLHVVENPLSAGVWSSDMYTAEIDGLQINLVDDAAERLQELVPPGAQWMTTEVRTGPAAKEILAVAEERKVDLIVMGTRGRTGLAHLLLGSVAERVVRMASCPVLTLHAPDKPQAAAA